MRKNFAQIIPFIIVAGVVVLIGLTLWLNIRSPAKTLVTEVNAYAIESNDGDFDIPVLVDDNKIQNMKLEEYVSRVLLGEVSSNFHIEALKAQAVAARTYTLRCVRIGKKHKDGAVCTDYRCCQAYCDPTEYLRMGGTGKEVDVIRQAVKQTAGEVLVHNDELINATYFASSGGYTEDAKNVWGKSYPYLQPVESPGEEECGYFEEIKSITGTELQERLNVELAGRPDQWFGVVIRTSGNGVALIRIGGRLYTGIELRKLLSLRSTLFEVSVDGNLILFQTRGYGHRVGMSQHGANAMAGVGNDYKAILHHYYQNVELERYCTKND